MPSTGEAPGPAEKPFFYGWYIVGVGFLAHVASAFSLSSTLGVFLKSLTQDLGVSRGVFSLMRSGEGMIGAALSPLVGSLVDRHGARWLMAGGALVVGAGLLLLSQVDAFWQFALARWGLVSVGDAFMGTLVINVTLSRWFSRRRGRAIALSSMGVGFAKVGMPVIAASLMVWIGWRLTWGVFGLLTIGLVIVPAILYMRRRPEDMGLRPDGIEEPQEDRRISEKSKRGSTLFDLHPADETIWSRGEAMRTRTFWLIVVTIGISSIGIAGLNLHAFAYVSDLGHPPIVAGTVLSVIALMQLSSPLMWGLLGERIDIRKVMMLKFLIQAAGISVAILTDRLAFLYAGFFLYGIGLGGNMVLPDLLWARYFGTLSLGTVRGVGMLLTHVFAASGPPFFGFLFDLTRSYFLSFSLFIMALIISSFLALLLRPPVKPLLKAHAD